MISICRVSTGDSSRMVRAARPTARLSSEMRVLVKVTFNVSSVERTRMFLKSCFSSSLTRCRLCVGSSSHSCKLGRGVTLEELGGAGLCLVSDLSTGVTGEIHFVDSGYNVIAMPHPEALKAAGGKVEGNGA